MQRIADAYPNTQTIHIIMDNLSTHREKSLTDRWGLAYGRELWSRFTIHYTPKHGSWLNPAEIEASMWSRESRGTGGIAYGRCIRAAQLTCRFFSSAS